MRRIAVSLLVMLSALVLVQPALAAPSTADASAPAAQVDPETRAAIELLLQHMDYDHLMAQILDTAKKQAGQQVGSVMRQQLDEGGYTPEQRAAIDAKLPAFLEKLQQNVSDFIDKAMPSAQLHDVMVQTYSANFTVAEIQDVDHFYATPTGQKMLHRMPQIMQQMMGSIQSRMLKEQAQLIRQTTADTFAFLRDACDCSPK